MKASNAEKGAYLGIERETLLEKADKSQMMTRSPPNYSSGCSALQGPKLTDAVAKARGCGRPA